jgi:hypothetical protein
MTIQLHTYLAGISQTFGREIIYRVQNIQHTPEPLTIDLEQKIMQFQKDCAEEYLPAIAQIKKDFGWYLPEEEQNERDYQVAYLADWYEYALAQPLNNTILLNMHSDEQKRQALDLWARKIQDFVRTYARASTSAKAMY